MLHADLTESKGALAMDGFTRLVMTRFAVDWLRPRMWAIPAPPQRLRRDHVALAEMLGATALLTTDARLAAAPAIQCLVEVV